MTQPVPIKEAIRPRRTVTLRRILQNLFLLTVGSCLFAVGINGLLVPHTFTSGGIIGISLILHYLTDWTSVGVAYFLLNIPLIILGWLSVSRTFVLYTCFGAGIGITLRSRGSAGGIDILAVFLNKKWSFRIGATTFLANALVLIAGGFCFGIEKALYSLIYVYTSSKVLDYVLTGFNQRKSILIISNSAREIADQILARLHRGATFLQGSGAYSGSEKQVILSIITLTELSKLKELVFDIDPDAFVVVNDTLEVLGKRHGNIRAD